jgi:hypothetical protein
MVVLDSLVIVSALPRMQHDPHAVASLQWTVNSYGISCGELRFFSNSWLGA